MKGGHQGLVAFDTTVEKAEKQGSAWVLTLRQEIEGSEQDRWWQEEFDAVVVATGHYNVPYLPNIPGLVEVEKRFPGTVSHSKHYRRKADFEGKVGSINQSQEAAVADILFSQRKRSSSVDRYLPSMPSTISEPYQQARSLCLFESPWQHLAGHLSHIQISL